jgi:proline dehydrogenase
MIRQFFLFLSQQRALRRWTETHPAAKRLTRRFVAGETLEEELAVCARLQAEGISSTLDHLGENVTSLIDAKDSSAAYVEALHEIAQRGLPATVSVKLTQFGVDLSQQACFESVRDLAEQATRIGSRVEIDMESSIYTDRTLDIATRIAQQHSDVRCVIQAYLYRSEGDIAYLNGQGVPVRLCKGAYNEPAEVSFPEKRQVDENYIKLMKVLLDHGTYPAIATHDEKIINEALRYVKERGIAAERFEFQMLYGIRRDLQQKVRAQGYRLRLYVPYGTAWYPYFMRRLAERPANVLFILRSFLHR